MVAVSEKQEEDQTLPTYTLSDVPLPISVPSSSYPSRESTTTPPLAPPTNFLTIVRDNNSIKGIYTIDTSMPMPPSAVPSTGDDGRHLNMRAASQNGSVDLTIELARSGDDKGPARLHADSRNGNVTVTVHDKRQNRFHLKMTSNNGAVSVRIPSTYVGTVSTRVENGVLTFSPSIQARLTTFSEQDKEGRFFIGDYPSSGYEGEETWLGDHVRVESANGRVKVDFVDENSLLSSNILNLFRRR